MDTNRSRKGERNVSVGVSLLFYASWTFVSIGGLAGESSRRQFPRDPIGSFGFFWASTDEGRKDTLTTQLLQAFTPRLTRLDSHKS
jgi:hypothetical protein